MSSSLGFLFGAGIVVSFVLTIYYGVQFGKYRPYGCYDGNGVNLCENWSEKSVTYIEYQNANSPTIVPDCNCSSCVNSGTCNCNYLMCYLVAEYDNGQQCNVAHDYSYDGSSSSYDTLFSYSELMYKYPIGDTGDKYTNNKKFDGVCMSVSDVESVGIELYNFFVGMVVSGSVLVAILIGLAMTVCLIMSAFGG